MNGRTSSHKILASEEKAFIIISSCGVKVGLPALLPIDVEVSAFIIERMK